MLKGVRLWLYDFEADVMPIFNLLYICHYSYGYFDVGRYFQILSFTFNRETLCTMDYINLEQYYYLLSLLRTRVKIVFNKGFVSMSSQICESYASTNDHTQECVLIIIDFLCDHYTREWCNLSECVKNSPAH